MDGTNHSLFDPRCREQAPLAIDVIMQLDIFGIVLFSVLTFMATVSILIFIEECIYIYKKVPPNKKTLIIWVTGASPVIGTMSCLGMWVPKATMFCDMTSATYFAIVIFKFLILMIEEVGGDDAFLRRSEKETLRISTAPCCCCCPCLPNAFITPRNLFMLKLGSFQFALLKLVFTILSIVLWTNGNYDPADVSMSGGAIWINSFIGILTIVGLWPVSIIFIHLKESLRVLKIVPKYAMYQMVLILSQLQTAIINILAMNGTIACSPPYTSQARGYLMSQQLLIVEMFIITLVNRILYRRQYDPLPEEDGEEEIKKTLTSKSAVDNV
ncbi:organic solute transporter subunit alpha [Triplophysa dalaica]|uniref:organic solute transporter subunit alpha n=1 Tax=Triplophysa dalaica TaxID=1582913 RepID=UPI0024DFC892|nr:organic solute transporter subunit alpha [Triplophysa dalaica]